VRLVTQLRLTLLDLLEGKKKRRIVTPASISPWVIVKLLSNSLSTLPIHPTLTH
jgi:hypothetical protein